MDAPERNWPKVPGIKAARAERTDNPKLVRANAILSVGKRTKLLAFGVALDRGGIWQWASIDADGIRRYRDKIARPGHNGLDKRRKAIWAGTHRVAVVRLASHRRPATVGAKEDVRGWIVNRRFRLELLTIKSEWR